MRCGGPAWLGATKRASPVLRERPTTCSEGSNGTPIGIDCVTLAVVRAAMARLPGGVGCFLVVRRGRAAVRGFSGGPLVARQPQHPPNLAPATAPEGRPSLAHARGRPSILWARMFLFTCVVP